MEMVLLTALGVGGATLFGSLMGFAFKKISLILKHIWQRVFDSFSQIWEEIYRFHCNSWMNHILYHCRHAVNLCCHIKRALPDRSYIYV